MKVLFVCILICLSALCGFAQQPLDVSNIPDDLKQNADAVVRYHTTRYERLSLSKYRVTVNYAITIFRSDAKYASILRIFYDRNSDINKVNGAIYDSKGNLKEKIKEKDMNDVAARNNITLFSDHRLKIYFPTISRYPFTIEYSYEIEYKETVGFDIWMPKDRFNLALEKAELYFITRNDLDIKHKEINYQFEKERSLKENMIEYSWSMRNSKAIQNEPYTLSFLEIMPAILLSPNKIQYEGVKGDFSDWTQYGKWTYSLIEDKSNISQERISYLNSFTDTIKSTREKIKAVYEYMQNRTRYVNISLRIGGFEPIAADIVDEKGYGDCKALTNYTKAMLEAIGIKSYYAEIGSGTYHELKYPDFCSANQTNHIILCVPNSNDTIWLECTNQNIPFGYLTTGNLNRYALLITPEGGKLVRTPVYTSNKNRIVNNTTIIVDGNGNAVFSSERNYHNYAFNELLSLLSASEKEQKNMLLKDYFPDGVIIDEIHFEDVSNNEVEGWLKTQGNKIKYASTVGNRMFFSPEITKNNIYISHIPTDRQLDIYHPIGISYYDTIHIEIPDNHKVEFLPEDIHLSSVYGQFEYGSNIKNHDITITIMKKLNAGRYSKSDFKEIREFIEAVEQKSTEKILLHKIE